MDAQEELLITRTFIKEVMKKDDALTKAFFNTGRPYRYLGQYAAMLRRAGVKKTQVELLQYFHVLVREIATECYQEFEKCNRWDEVQERWIPIESING
jgi:hypothetical protein